MASSPDGTSEIRDGQKFSDIELSLLKQSQPVVDGTFERNVSTGRPLGSIDFIPKAIKAWLQAFDIKFKVQIELFTRESAKRNFN